MKAAPLAVLASMIWLTPGCGGDEDEGDGTAGSAGTNVVGGTTGEGGEPASSSGGSGATGGTGTGGDDGAGGSLPQTLECLGDALPETAPDNVVIEGLVTTLGNVIIDGALVEGHAASNDELLGDDTSALNGSYELTLPTDGVPLDAYLLVSADGNVDSYVYPAVPFAADAGLDVPLVTSELRDGLADEASVALEADKGVLYVFVRDCNGDPIEGATVTTNPPGELSYTTGFIPSPDATSTDGSGAAYIFNLPPGDVEVDASIDGYSLREHTIEIRANVITITSVIP